MHRFEMSRVAARPSGSLHGGRANRDWELSPTGDDASCYAAVIGRAKRGKSTLVDALLDTPLVSSAWYRPTVLPAVIRHAPALRMAVRSRDAHHQFVTQSIEPRELRDCLADRRSADTTVPIALDIGFASPMLANGLWLVDTPAHDPSNDAPFVPPSIVPRIDIVIAVIDHESVSLDSELRLIASVPTHSSSRLLVVFNKIDEVDEDDRRQTVGFAELALASRMHGIVPRIYGVSARQRLNGDGRPGDWDEFLEALWCAIAERRAAAVTAASH